MTPEDRSGLKFFFPLVCYRLFPRSSCSRSLTVRKTLMVGRKKKPTLIRPREKNERFGPACRNHGAGFVTRDLRLFSSTYGCPLRSSPFFILVCTGASFVRTRRRRRRGAPRAELFLHLSIQVGKKKVRCNSRQRHNGHLSTSMYVALAGVRPVTTATLTRSEHCNNDYN